MSRSGRTLAIAAAVCIAIIAVIVVAAGGNSDGPAAFMSRDDRLAIYVKWTRTGDDVSGSLSANEVAQPQAASQAGFFSTAPAPGQIVQQRATFTGTVRDDSGRLLIGSGMLSNRINGRLDGDTLELTVRQRDRRDRQQRRDQQRPVQTMLDPPSAFVHTHPFDGQAQRPTGQESSTTPPPLGLLPRAGPSARHATSLARKAVPRRLQPGARGFPARLKHEHVAASRPVDCCRAEVESDTAPPEQQHPLAREAVSPLLIWNSRHRWSASDYPWII